MARMANRMAGVCVCTTGRGKQTRPWYRTLIDRERSFICTFRGWVVCASAYRFWWTPLWCCWPPLSTIITIIVERSKWSKSTFFFFFFFASSPSYLDDYFQFVLADGLPPLSGLLISASGVFRCCRLNLVGIILLLLWCCSYYNHSGPLIIGSFSSWCQSAVRVWALSVSIIFFTYNTNVLYKTVL